MAREAANLEATVQRLESEMAPAPARAPQDGENPVTLIELVQRARNSEGGERTWLATLVNQRLKQLKALPDAEQLAGFLLEQLDDRQYGELVDKHGWPCRAATVEALIELGYPRALELDPDDVEYLTVQRRERVVRFPPARISAAVGLAVGAGGLALTLTGRFPNLELLLMGAVAGPLMALGHLGLLLSNPRGGGRRVLELLGGTTAVLLGTSTALQGAPPWGPATAAAWVVAGVTGVSVLTSFIERRLQPR